MSADAAGHDVMHVGVRGGSLTAPGSRVSGLIDVGGCGSRAHLEPGMRVRVTGLQNRADLNGKLAVLKSFAPSEDRWNVWFDEGFGKQLRPHNVTPLSPLSEVNGRSSPSGPCGGLNVAAGKPGSLVGQSIQSENIDIAAANRVVSPDAWRTQEVDASIAPGSQVRILGLQARPELNGSAGTVVHFVAAEGRWKVKLSDDSMLGVRPQHLEVIPAVCEAQNEDAAEKPQPSSTRSAALGGCALMGELAPGVRIRVQGLEERPEFNGCEGELLEAVPEEGRWKLQLVTGRRLLLKDSNLEVLGPPSGGNAGGVPQTLVAGRRVRVCHLALSGNWAHLNGKLGTLVEQQVDGKWKVCLEDGSGKLLNAENLMSAEGLATPAAHDLYAGQHVRIIGPDTRPDLIGLEGELLEFLRAEGRWQVRLDDDGVSKFLFPENLQACGAMTAADRNGLQKACTPAETIADGQPLGTAWAGRPEEQGGKAATSHCEDALVAPGDGNVDAAVHSDAAASHSVLSAGSQDESAAPQIAAVSADGSLMPGVEVEVVGIKSQSHLNGQQGTLVAFDEVAGRWKVWMQDGTGKFLKPTNLRVLEKLPQHSQQEEKGSVTSQEPTASNPGLAEEGGPLRAVPLPSLLPDQRVRIVGLEGRPELNGHRGTLVEYVPESGVTGDSRWKVCLDDGSGKLLKEVNLEVIEDETVDSPSSMEDHLDSSEAAPSGAEMHPNGPTGAGSDALLPGQDVRLKGLLGCPELNGAVGRLVDFDPSDGRWKVLLSDGSGKRLLPGNLQRAPASAFRRKSFGSTDGAADDEWSGPKKGTPRSQSPDARRNEQRGSGQNGLARQKHEDVAASPHVSVHSPGHATDATDVVEDVAVESDAVAFETGQRIRVVGLVARPELNNLEGEVVGFDAEDRRWKVRCHSSSNGAVRPLKLKSANIQLVEKAASPAAAAASTPPAPLQQAERWRERSPLTAAAASSSSDERRLPESAAVQGASAWPSESSRLAADLSRSDSSVFKEGQRVRIVSLHLKPQNRQECTVQSFEPLERKWRVTLDDGSELLLLPQSMEPCARAEQDGRLRTGASYEAWQSATPSTSRSSADKATLKPGQRARVLLDVTLVEHHDASGLWKVELHDGTFKMVEPAQISLQQDACAGFGASDTPASSSSSAYRSSQQAASSSAKHTLALQRGLHVRVARLISRPELNGLEGTLEQYNESEDRWQVGLDNGSRMLFNVDNLDALPPKIPHEGSMSQRPRPGQVVRQSLYAGFGKFPKAEGVTWDTHLGPAVQVDAASAKPNVPPSRGSARPTVTFLDDYEQMMPMSSGGAAAGGFCVGDRSRVTGLVARPELNGCGGVTVEFDAAEGRWKVCLDRGDGKALKPSNLVLETEAQAERATPADALRQVPTSCLHGRELAAGRRVRVVDLIGRPELNGQYGTTVDYIEAEGRWKVRMDDCSGKLLKPINLVVMEDAQSPLHPASATAVGPAASSSSSSAPAAAPSAPASGATPGKTPLSPGTGQPPSPSGASLYSSTTSSPRGGLGGGSSSAFAPGMRVKVRGLLSRPELNDQCGVVVDVEGEEGRCKVMMDDATGKSFRFPNLEIVEAARTHDESLSEGQRVRITGLITRPELNGLMGTVVGRDEEQRRLWKVRMDDESGKMLNAYNLEILAEATAGSVGERNVTISGCAGSRLG
eukprot:TRINITY_DN8390_c0_g1_i1.p1 TRINITY_DN8390_c0_g1~~TRINITY_DN8390_c0_g1_i1.p1  ORF type:complete len:1680 (-),score=385.42 TRINITY_DN8390_c0_g1_i1:11-5050(-)